MYRDGPLIWRIIHPTTLLFFILVTIYAIGVDYFVFVPIELTFRSLPIPRWLVTLVAYGVLLLIVALVFRWLDRRQRSSWVDAIAINRGGVWLFDLLLGGIAIAGIYLLWRYLGFFEPELVPLAGIALLTAVVGLFHSPPWRHILIFQRSSDKDQAGLLPPWSRILETYSPMELDRALAFEEDLLAANPTIRREKETAGEELYIPVELRPTNEAQVDDADNDTLPLPE